MANQKNQPIPTELKDRLFNYAHDHRTSMSDVVGAVIGKIARGESTPPARKVRGDVVMLKYKTPDEYAIAMERARAEGVALQTWVALELERTVKAEAE